MRQRHISLEEAQEMLPFVRKRMAELRRLDRAIEILDNVGIMFDDEFLAMKQEIHENKKFHELNAEFYSVLSELIGKGCIVKDLRRGLVDFYSMHQGKEIFLSYILGEDRIRFWRDIDCDFEQRKPISQLNR